jgi:hypothetical protein
MNTQAAERFNCPECGESIPVVAKVCRFCNAVITDKDRANAQVAPPRAPRYATLASRRPVVIRQESAPSKHSFPIVGVIAAALIVIIIAAIAIPNMLRSRMTENEDCTIDACRFYCEAQELYRRRPRSGVCYFAHSLRELADADLINKEMAAAEGDPGKVKPYRGYVFKVLTSQGPGAVGGAENFMDADGRMTLHFGLCAIG